MEKILVLLISGLLIMSTYKMQAQGWVVTSKFDDPQAHPYDNPNTMDLDEAHDGLCGDSLGRCTLRAALEEIASLSLTTTLTFGFSGTIQKDPSLMEFIIPEHLKINGANQQVTIRGNGNDFLFLVTSDVSIKGLVFSHALSGIDVVGPNNVIGGKTAQDRNVIIGMAQTGINLIGDNNVVKGNFVGINAQENVDGNRIGIEVLGKNNTIGGITNGEENVVSGNDIGIASASFMGNTYIIHNIIGTNSGGDQARANNVGINIIGPNTTVGGITTQEGNLIAGNRDSGILVGVQSDNVIITGNEIGKIGSNFGAPNRNGIVLGPGSFSARVEKNTIRGNTSLGIHIVGLENELQSAAHRIGDNDIEDNNVGIMIQGNAYENIIGSPLNLDFRSNIIKHNTGQGVLFTLGEDGTIPQKNTIRRNKFQRNGAMGILIVTGQDGIEKPVIDSFRNNGVRAIVTGTHPRAGSTIDVYSGIKNSAGFYEGYDWLGKGVVSQDHKFKFQCDQANLGIIVATATDPDGNTSEFSDSTEVEGPLIFIQPPGYIIAPPPPPGPFQDGPVIRFRVSDPGNVDLKLYDLSGHQLETLFHEYALPGEYDRIWNLRNYPPGIYLYKFSQGNRPAIVGKLISVQ